MKPHFFFATALAVTGVGSTLQAAVPAGYAGTPFNGAGGHPAGPYPIPGRIDLINYDMGGPGVGFNVTHKGDVGCAGYDYRKDLPVATLCKTSALEGDKWYGAGGTLDGTQFPTATTADYYVGAIRPGDSVNVTVNVLTAGTYRVSSTWATGAAAVHIQIYFNGVMKSDSTLAMTPPATYHAWKPYPDFATLQLDAGLQVMKFQSVIEHVNMDYVQFSLVLPDGGVDPGSSDGGGGSGSGTSAGSGMSAGSGSAPSGSPAASGSAMTSGSVASSGTAASGDVVAASGTVATSGGVAASGDGSSGAVTAGSGTPSGNGGGISGAAAGTGGAAGGNAVGGASGSAVGSANPNASGCTIGGAPLRRCSSSAAALALAVAGAFFGRTRRARRRS